MTVDQFAERLARVRQRFVTTLEGKIADANAAVPKLQNTIPDAAQAVEESYRAMHSIVGVGPTVGFPDTGRTARLVEDVLREPQHAKRGLTADEITQVKKRLYELRQAAERELQTFYSV